MNRMIFIIYAVWHIMRPTSKPPCNIEIAVFVCVYAYLELMQGSGLSCW